MGLSDRVLRVTAVTGMTLVALVFAGHVVGTALDLPALAQQSIGGASGLLAGLAGLLELRRTIGGTS